MFSVLTYSVTSKPYNSHYSNQKPNTVTSAKPYQQATEAEKAALSPGLIEDNITIWSNSLSDHVEHIDSVFALFEQVQIGLSPSKSLIAYPSVKLLGEEVNLFSLATAKENIELISHLAFPNSLKNLERYLVLTG